MTREEAINSLRDKITEIRAYCDEAKHMSEDDRQDIETFDMAIKALEQEPRWIPVSERLPQENERVLRVLVTIHTPHRTSVRSGIFFYPWFSIDNGDCWRFNEEEVVGWMPLPKPYEPQESEE